MMKPHKWAKEIKAWADGAEIQFKDSNDANEWLDTKEPTWEILDFLEYRIKPQPKEPHEVSEQYGKAMQQAYEDGFVQGKIYAETGRVSDGKTIPKASQYLYVYATMSGFEITNEKTGIVGYVGKIKLETDDE